MKQTSFAVALVLASLHSAIPSFAEPAPGANSEQRQPRLEVTWENRLVTLDAVEMDLAATVKALSEKTGVEITLFEGVTGKVTLREEKVPLEKVVDDLLTAVGQRNYLMVFDGGGLTKLTIVPKGKGGAGLSEEAKRVKVKGRLRREGVFRESKDKYTEQGKPVTGDLRTGKEIEYYPGEIVITTYRNLRSSVEDEKSLSVLVERLEREHGLALINKSILMLFHVLKFRVLNGRDVIDVMYEIAESGKRTGGISPNGLGPRSAEFPEQDLHVYRDLTTEDWRDCRARGLVWYTQCMMDKNPFLKMEYLKDDALGPFKYFEGVFRAGLFSWEMIASLVGTANDEGGLVIGTGSETYYYFPWLHGAAEHAAMVKKLGDMPKNWRDQYEGGCRVNDTLYPQQWNLTRVRADYGRELEQGSRDVRLAIMEQNFDSDHEDYWSRLAALESAVFPRDAFLARGADNLSSGAMYPGHGSRVSGIAGAITNNGKGVAGVAGGACNPGKGVTLLGLQIDAEPESAQRAFWYAAGLVFADSVEYAPGEIDIQKPWVIPGPWGVFTEPEGNHVWVDSPGGNYQDNDNTVLELKPIDLRGTEGMELRLSFRAKHTLATGDLVHVERSGDGGRNWFTLGSPLSGVQQGWALSTRDISFGPPDLRPDAFQIRFRLAGNGDGQTADGVYLDDIEIQILDPSTQPRQHKSLAAVVNVSQDLYMDPAYVFHAAAAAYAKGISIVFAAGQSDNVGQSRDSILAMRDGKPTPIGIDEKILVVTATERDDSRWRPAMYGGFVDVSAPGVDILSSTIGGAYTSITEPKSDSVEIDGTSYAAPHVAALAALLVSKYPSLTPTQVYARIKNTADPLAGQPGMGAGRINLYSALRGGTRDGEAPSGPTDAKAVGGSQKITITWKPATDNDAIGDYVVLRRDLSGAVCPWPVTIDSKEYCELARVSEDGSNTPGTLPSSFQGGVYTLEDTSAGNAYYLYRVIAYDKTGNAGPPSAELSPLGKPTGLVGRGGDGRAKFVWTRPALYLNMVVGYRFTYASLDNAQNWTTIDVATNTLERSLVNGMTYVACVKAVDSGGNESECSAWVTVIPDDAIWVHQTDGPSGSKATIGGALNAAGQGDTIIVGAGVYNAQGLALPASSITLRSERGPQETIVDAVDSDTFQLLASDGSSIIGFTFRNFDKYSGSIYCYFANDVLIANNIFIANAVGVQLSSSFDGVAQPIRIYNNVFVADAKGIQTYANYQYTTISNNIFVDNATGLSLDFSAIDPYEVTEKFRVDYNDLFSNDQDYDYLAGRHFYHEFNIAANPDFLTYDPAHPEAADYHLGTSSPCRDEGARNRDDNGVPWIDCDGSTADMGAYGGPLAVVDNDRNGIPDCQQPRIVATTHHVFKNSIDQPVTLTGHDPLGGSLVYTITRSPAHGTLTGTAPNLLYTVEREYTGTDSFTYEVSNGLLNSRPQDATIIVKDGNSDPQAYDQTVRLPPGPRPVVFTISAGDADGDRLTYTIDSASIIGTFICDNPPYCWYAPAENFVGATSFTYQVSDGITVSAPGTVTIIVNNDPVLGFFYPGSDDVEIVGDASQVFQVEVSDADASQQLTSVWTIDGAPVGSGTAYTFTPAPASPAGPFVVRVVVSDGLSSVEHSWTVRVRRVEIVDNLSCTFSGSWVTSTSGTGYLGGDFRAHVNGTGTGYATWTAALHLPGVYKVFARWPAASTYAQNAVYRVTYAGGLTDDLMVDQTTNGGVWNLLGTYRFDGAGEVRLTAGNGEVAVADAVRFVATDDPADIILDDAGGVAVGVWDSASGGFAGGYRAANGTSEGSSFTWTPALVAPGTWDIHARWVTNPNGATNAKYVVSYDGARNTQITVDQTVSGGRWNLVGTTSFEQTDTPAISLGDNANGKVVADAVKLTYRDGGSVTVVDNDGDADLDPAAGDYFGWSGSWTASTALAGYVGVTYRQIGAGSGGWAKWVLPVAAPGNYEVYARWTAASGRSDAARYEVRRKDLAAAVVLVDQRADGGTWHYLGRYDCDTGSETSVKLLQSADGSVVADAVLFMQTDEELPLVIDNAGTGGFTKSAGWIQPSPLLAGHWGSNYFQTSTATAGKDATWTAELPTAGNYEIFARWTAAADRSASVKYTIGGDGGPSVRKNQRNSGGDWVSLGRFSRPAGATSVKVDSQDDGITVADAVRFDYTVLPTSTDVDDADLEPPDYCAVTGSWTTAATLTNDKFDGYKTRPAGGTARIRWTPALPLRGYYGVYAWWPVTNSTYATNAPFTIVSSLAPQGETRLVDQQVNGGKWNYLGTYFFDAGESGYVELASADANGKVVGDAVRFVAEGD